MNILLVGDIFSKLGRKAFKEALTELRNEYTINFIVANGENISHGRGMNEAHYKWLLENGVNVITMGNHTYQNGQIFNYIDDAQNLVRPANFNDEAKGRGYTVVKYNNIKICVLQVIGTVFMAPNNKNPFITAQELIDNVEADIYICDFHGEATSEKIAFGYAFDGKINIIFGTHTHVQTNDARILSKGSAYISDLGMCGSFDGVIGIKKEIIVARNFNPTDQTPFEPLDTGKYQFSGMLVDIDERTKVIRSVKPLHIVK